MSEGGFKLRDDEPALGETHAGCVLEALLGRGAMGSVYLARRTHDSAGVVVKFLAADMAKNPTLRARFQREWEALRKIHPHPNVMQVLAVEVSGERPCIVLEYVAGAELERALKERTRLDPRRAVEIARDMALGLAAVHAHGLIHRDVKPANVIVTPEGAAKLVDFGLAKDLFQSGLTRPGQLLGTAHYMAPEQWEDEGIDARCDIFSLGATLYHLLSGSPPFDGEDMDEVADLAIAGDYPPLCEVLPSVPPELELAVAQMLMPDLRYRYATMKHCAEDLEAILAGGEARVPCLRLASGGQRFPLLLGEFFTLGSDPKSAIHLPHPSVAAKHAQVRREPSGFVLRDLKSPSGTFANGERVVPGRARPLTNGTQVKLGEQVLVFEELVEGRAVAAFLQDVARSAEPAPIVDGLAELKDPRSVLALIERLAADRYADSLADRTLATCFGADAAREIAERRSHLARAQAAAAGATLEAITQIKVQDPSKWLSWWHQVRTTAPPQVGISEPRRELRLRVTQGPLGRIDLPLGDEALIFIGRDEKCQLRIDAPSVPRLLATVLRLHRRLVVIDEGSAHGTVLNGVRVRQGFLDPGDTLVLGPVQLVLEASTPPPERLASGWLVADPLTAEALAASGHAGACSALIGALQEPLETRWCEARARALFAEAPAQASALAHCVAAHLRSRSERAHRTLATLFRQDVGPDPAAWGRLLAERSSALPPQVVPRGWLACTRDQA